MSVKAILNWVTIALIVILLILSRKELVHAFELLGQVNLLLLSLIIPLQFLSYYASGEVFFTYLKAKGTIKPVNPMERTEMALEMNFVNHALPSGGVSGLSYMTWRLGKVGVSPGRAASSQVVRFVAGFIAMIILITISVIVVTIDGHVNRWIILFSSALIASMIAVSLTLAFIVGNKRRMERTAEVIARRLNRLTHKLTRGKKRRLVKEAKIMHFFSEMHDDYVELRRDIGVLKRPVLWAILYTALEGLMFWVAFTALGTPVNPALILIAYSVASVAAFAAVTPGGAGAYEAVMVAILAVGGVASGAAVAGTVLTRVILLLFTIAVGYFFYQRALHRYGSKQSKSFLRR